MSREPFSAKSVPIFHAFDCLPSDSAFVVGLVLTQRVLVLQMQPGDKDVLKKGEVGPAQRGGGGGQGEAIGGGDKEGDDKPGEREEGDKTAAAGAADKARPELIKRCREAVLWEVMFRYCALTLAFLSLQRVHVRLGLSFQAAPRT